MQIVMAPLSWLPRLSGAFARALFPHVAQLAERSGGSAIGAKVARFSAGAWHQSGKPGYFAPSTRMSDAEHVSQHFTPVLLEGPGLKNCRLRSIYLHSSSKRALGSAEDGSLLVDYQEVANYECPSSEKVLVSEISENNGEGRSEDGALPGLAASSKLGGSKAVAKKCRRCGDKKLLVDFVRSGSGPDGLSELCRGCLSIFHAKPVGRLLPGHMQLSLEEAQERAKTCERCGVSKEIRQFGMYQGRKDGTQKWCRACISDYKMNCFPYAPEMNCFPYAPARGPKVCNRCNNYLPVEAFGRNRRHSSGLSYRCKRCVKEQQTSRARNPKIIASQLYITRDAKRCINCKVVKEASEFSRDLIEVDGLQSRCKLCNTLRVKKRYEKRLK